MRILFDINSEISVGFVLGSNIRVKLRLPNDKKIRQIPPENIRRKRGRLAPVVYFYVWDT